ncbi:MAG: hypothetical protein IJ679_05795, partial [Lachnospiraceae bacterium]|nr:hypothetical protein [Lachnospiraceae bacterium]
SSSGGNSSGSDNSGSSSSSGNGSGSDDSSSSGGNSSGSGQAEDTTHSIHVEIPYEYASTEITVNGMEGSKAKSKDAIGVHIIYQKNIYKINFVVQDADGKTYTTTKQDTASSDYDDFVFAMPDADVYLRATFEKIDTTPDLEAHSITIDAPDYVDKAIYVGETPVSEAKSGDTVTIRLRYDKEQYAIRSVAAQTVNGRALTTTPLSSSSLLFSEYEFTMPDAAVKVDCTFEPIFRSHSITLDVSPQDVGTISVLDSNSTEIQSAKVGDTVTIRISAYDASQYSLNVRTQTTEEQTVPTTPTTYNDHMDYSFAMPDKDVIVSIEFIQEMPVLEKHSITVEASPQDVGTIAVKGSEGTTIDKAKEGETVVVLVSGFDTEEYTPSFWVQTTDEETVPTNIKSSGENFYEYEFEMPDKNVNVMITFIKETPILVPHPVRVSVPNFVNTSILINGEIDAMGWARSGDSVAVRLTYDRERYGIPTVLRQDSNDSTGTQTLEAQSPTATEYLDFPFEMPDAVVNVNAAFESYAIGVISSPDDKGTITIPDHSDSTALKGEDVTISVVCDYTHYSTSIKVITESAEMLTPDLKTSDDTHKEYTFRMPGEAVSVSVAFVDQSMTTDTGHTVSVSFNPNVGLTAEVIVGGATVSATDTIEPNTEVVVQVSYSADSFEYTGYTVMDTNGAPPSVTRTQDTEEGCDYYTFTMPDYDVNLVLGYKGLISHSAYLSILPTPVNSVPSGTVTVNGKLSNTAKAGDNVVMELSYPNVFVFQRIQATATYDDGRVVDFVPDRNHRSDYNDLFSFVMPNAKVDVVVEYENTSNTNTSTSSDTPDTTGSAGPEMDDIGQVDLEPVSDNAVPLGEAIPLIFSDEGRVADGTNDEDIPDVPIHLDEIWEEDDAEDPEEDEEQDDDNDPEDEKQGEIIAAEEASEDAMLNEENDSTSEELFVDEDTGDASEETLGESEEDSLSEENIAEEEDSDISEEEIEEIEVIEEDELSEEEFESETDSDYSEEEFESEADELEFEEEFAEDADELDFEEGFVDEVDALDSEEGFADEADALDSVEEFADEADALDSEEEFKEEIDGANSEEGSAMTESIFE